MKFSAGADGRWHAGAAEGIHAFIKERFPAAADLLHTPDRRQFMRLMAASLALSGLAGCDDDDAHDQIVPPVTQAAGSAPGRVLTYASSTLLDGFANGVLVKTRDGRPIKIEGNPQHPWSRGGTDVFGQASVLGLYDPFRSQSVQHQTRDSSWDEFRLGMVAQQARLRAGGAGFALLLGPHTSPSLIAQVAALQAAWPEMRVYTHAPVTRTALYEATRQAFGRPLETHWRLDQARALVCLDGDLLDAGPHQVGAARGWSVARRAMAANGALLELHAATAVPNLTTAKADHAFSAQPGLIAAMTQALLAHATGAAAPDLPADAAAWCTRAYQALDKARGAGVVQAGVHADPSVQIAVQRLNAALGNTGRTVMHTQTLHIPGDTLQALVTAMQRGEIDTLLMIGANPVYDAPSALGFADALSRVRLKIHANLYADETAAYADWHLPLAHPLESWSDARALDGTASLIQPTVAPLYGGRTAAEILSAMADPKPLSSLDLLRAHWVRAEQDEPRWHQALLTGIFADSTAPLETVQLSAAPPAIIADTAGTIDVVFRPDPTVWDGTVADNAWLQELPKPLTKLVWENAIQIGPVLAKRSGLSNGDVAELSANGAHVTGPVWIAPGQADNVVCLSLGYGKRAAGQLSAGLGYDAAPLRPADGTWRVPGATLRRTGATRSLAGTQDHARMDGDGFVRVQRVGATPVGDGDAAIPTLYAKQDSDGRAWGMVIDLDTCIGCNACITACQSENNIAVVGRDEVLNGREMHWLRVDAYPAAAATDDAAALPVSFMPVPCMNCEQAPCEVGCPVEATLHDHEGLNLMVYNRCIGTRACSGYCPYKVRRFNYADYAAGAAPSIVEQRNPDVTVRARGVMEKCTYCVQRIAEARVVADRDDAPIADGTVQTACQGACPTQAIVFGDLAQSDSAVSRARRDPRRYALLGELNTRPRTTYLARWAV